MKVKLLALLGLLIVAPLALAQSKDYPNRPIRVLVGFTPGSSIDAASRFFGKKLSDDLGQPVIVENMPGASGVIAVRSVKNAPSDGYTILTTGMSQLLINPIMIKDLPYDPIEDFQPVSGLTRAMLVFAVVGESKMNNIQDLIVAAKSASEPLNAGSYSPGYQLYTEWFGELVKAKFNVIPYKGAAPVVTDLLGGRLHFAIMDISTAVPLAKSGRLKLLAVTGNKRSVDFPNVPTVKESGYPDYVGYAALAFHVKADTPAEVTSVLAASMKRIMATEDAAKFAETSGLELVHETPADLRKLQRDELTRLRAVAVKAGIGPQ